ncbi:MAG TPA: hypothetical protein VMZ03_09460 [Chitinophagaceae bacterium]|nr:hypothetical protein [Chitinophagaceae bacterium]
MRPRLIIPVLMLLLVACQSESPKGANGVVYKSAVEYNDYIVNRQTTLMKNILAFVDVAQADPDSAEKMLDKYVKETGVMITEIKGMPAYKGDSALRNAAANTFGFYRKLFDKEYRNILHLRSEGGVSADVEERIEAIVKGIEDEEKGFDDRFQDAQRSFARKNKMKLVENEMQKKLEEKTGTDK